MTQFIKLLERAGFQPLEDSQVIVPNQSFPVLSATKAGLELRTALLFCDRPENPPPLTFLYFTIPGCENCRSGLESLNVLAERDVSLGSSDKSACLRIVASDWPTRSELEHEFSELIAKRALQVIWDPDGVLQERLAVVGVPAAFLLDREGRVFALSNAPVEFSSPGFEGVWKALSIMTQNNANKTLPSAPLAKRLREEISVESSPIVTFLNKHSLSSLWLVAAIVLCYSFLRFFLRVRKNFGGSQNST